jgi:DNA-binding GntR family transcriptional regulator
LGDDVYDTILEMLTSNTTAPDTQLSIDGLAKSLSVSPTPVREALARLEHTGLVVRNAHRGYRVAPPMPRDELSELIDARTVLEIAALKRAAQDFNALIPDLEVALKKHRDAAAQVEKPDAVRDPKTLHIYFKADWLFHQAILDHCGNRYIDRAVNSLSFSNHRMRQMNSEGVTDASQALQEHTSVLDAVKTGDVDAAVFQMKQHLHNVQMRSTENI